jgi:hypothetical protein
MDSIIAALLASGAIDDETAGILQRQNDIDAARVWAENVLTTATQGALTAQQQRLLALLVNTENSPTAAELNTFWSAENDLLYDALEPDIMRLVLERATLAAVTTGQTFAYTNGLARAWAQTYYRSATEFGSVPNLNQTTRQQFQAVFDQWLGGQLGRRGLPDLITALTPTFGPVRARAIGVTETTRIFIESQRAVDRDNPYVIAYRWQTAADERAAVCPICGPMNGRIRRKDQGWGSGLDIPAHPRCRCHESRETAGTLGELPTGTPQPTPQATPEAVAAVGLTPSGKPISSALEIPRASNRVNDAARTVVDAIDSVHGDGKLFRIPIITPSNMGNSLGEFRYEINYGAPLEIAIKFRGERLHSTIAHEIGHFVEIGAIRNAVENSDAVAAAWANVVAVADATATLSKLRGLRDGAELLTIVRPDGTQYAARADKTHLDYLLREEEIWARAYAQYITVRSGQADLRNDLDGLRNQRYSTAWSDDDFEPVAAAIDNLFKVLGWMK